MLPVVIQLFDPARPCVSPHVTAWSALVPLFVSFQRITSAEEDRCSLLQNW